MSTFFVDLTLASTRRSAAATRSRRCNRCGDYKSPSELSSHRRSCTRSTVRTPPGHGLDLARDKGSAQVQSPSEGAHQRPSEEASGGPQEQGRTPALSSAQVRSRSPGRVELRLLRRRMDRILRSAAALDFVLVNCKCHLQKESSTGGMVL